MPEKLRKPLKHCKIFENIELFGKTQKKHCKNIENIENCK